MTVTHVEGVWVVSEPAVTICRARSLNLGEECAPISQVKPCVYKPLWAGEVGLGSGQSGLIPPPMQDPGPPEPRGGRGPDLRP